MNPWAKSLIFCVFSRNETIRNTPLLAIRFESLMESDDSLRRMPIERQGEEEFLRYTLMHKPGQVLEPKFSESRIYQRSNTNRQQTVCSLIQISFVTSRLPIEIYKFS